jgi:hypothetical protein
MRGRERDEMRGEERRGEELHGAADALIFPRAFCFVFDLHCGSVEAGKPTETKERGGKMKRGAQMVISYE